MAPKQDNSLLYLIMFLVTIPAQWTISAYPIILNTDEETLNGSDLISFLFYSDSMNDFLKYKRSLEQDTLYKSNNKDIFQDSVISKPVKINSRIKRHNFREIRSHEFRNIEPSQDSELEMASMVSGYANISTNNIETIKPKNNSQLMILSNISNANYKINITGEREIDNDTKIIEVRVTSSVAISRSSSNNNNSREAKSLSKNIEIVDQNIFDNDEETENYNYATNDASSDPILLAASEKRSIATVPLINNFTSHLKNKSHKHYRHRNHLSENIRRSDVQSFSYSSVFNDYRPEDPSVTVWTSNNNDKRKDGFSTSVNHNTHSRSPLFDRKYSPSKIELMAEDLSSSQSNDDSTTISKLPIVYSEPAKIYSEPAKVYSEPAKVYGKPEIFYSEPSRIYSEPAKVYSEPAKIYSEPAKVYSEPAKFYSEPASLHILIGKEQVKHRHRPHIPASRKEINMTQPFSSTTSPDMLAMKIDRTYEPSMNDRQEQNYEVDESMSVVSNGRAHGVQEIEVPNKGKKVGYVVEGKNFRKYRVEERTSDGFIVGEYGVVSHDDGSLRGVRYTADGETNPRLIYDALLKFLSL